MEKQYVVVKRYNEKKRKKKGYPEWYPFYFNCKKSTVLRTLKEFNIPYIEIMEKFHDGNIPIGSFYIVKNFIIKNEDSKFPNLYPFHFETQQKDIVLKTLKELNIPYSDIFRLV